MLQDIDDDSISIHSFQVLTEASTNSLHHNRKRKCQGEKQDWPTSKHTCFAPISTSDAQNIESTSEPDSVNDSNSLPAHSDSVASSYGQTKSDHEGSKDYAYDHVMGEYDSCNRADDGQLGYLNVEDHLREFEVHGNYGRSGCESDTMELGEEEDEDLGDLLYSDCSKVNPNMFVLSSGRWVVKQDDTQSATRKPTIDQEFEQYFSTLML